MLLPSAYEVCEGYVVTGVCHSVHGGGGGCLGPHLRGSAAMATAADGTHPTGMHSCFRMI